MKLVTDVGSPIDYEFRVTIRSPYIKLKILYIKLHFVHLQYLLWFV